MRFALFFALLAPSLAHADDDDIGVFVDEAFGTSTYRGELADHRANAFRIEVAFAVRRGPWTLRLLGGAVEADALFIDCYGKHCDAPEEPASHVFAGTDLKRAWPLFRSWQHTGVRFFMHGGPRWFSGSGTLEGYAGPGISGGAGIEGDFYLLGYYVDFGTDAFRMTSQMDVVHGSTPYVMVGGRMGWM